VNSLVSKREKCKEMMGKYFGAANAALVDSMSDSEIVEKCRAKIKGFLGDSKAKAFDDEMSRCS
jgi:monoamine oxidase